MSRRSVSPERPRFDVARAIDLLRQGAARTEALVYATEQQLERFTWSGRDQDDDIATENQLEETPWGGGGDEDSHRHRREHLAHLLAAAKEAARAVVAAGNKIAAELDKHRGEA